MPLQAFGQSSCDTSIRFAAARMSVSAAQARFRGCVAREDRLVQQDRDAYYEGRRPPQQQCAGEAVIYTACERESRNICTAREELEAARDACLQFDQEELDTITDAAEDLNDQRPDAGAGALSKKLTEQALKELDASIRTTLGALDGVIADADAVDPVGDTASTPRFSATTGPSSADQPNALPVDLQAILDQTVEGLQSAVQDGDLSVQEAQTLLNRGLRQIREDRDRQVRAAREEIWDNRVQGTAEDELAARMRAQLSAFSRSTAAQPPRAQQSRPSASTEVAACIQACVTWPSNTRSACSRCCQQLGAGVFTSCFPNSRTYFERWR